MTELELAGAEMREMDEKAARRRERNNHDRDGTGASELRLRNLRAGSGLEVRQADGAS